MLSNPLISPSPYRVSASGCAARWYTQELLSSHPRRLLDTQTVVNLATKPNEGWYRTELNELWQYGPGKTYWLTRQDPIWKSRGNARDLFWPVDFSPRLMPITIILTMTKNLLCHSRPSPNDPNRGVILDKSMLKRKQILFFLDLVLNKWVTHPLTIKLLRCPSALTTHWRRCNAICLW